MSLLSPARVHWLVPCAALLLAAAAPPAGAQLRPLDPIDWRTLTDARVWSATVGAAAFRHQTASLAGTRGDLWEAGNFRLGWRTGRVVIEGAGTLQRFFRDRERFASPDTNAYVTAPGPRRHDSGDYRIQTTVRLTPDAWRTLGVLRFGTRLPTTDNQTGLDRDATDFFFTLGARAPRGALTLDAEAGLGIVTTRRVSFEQEDVLLYVLGASYAAGPLTPSLTLVGQRRGASHREVRGNEDLSELRFGLRAGSRRWLRLEAVRGLEETSPKGGLILSMGVLR